MELSSFQSIHLSNPKVDLYNPKADLSTPKVEQIAEYILKIYPSPPAKSFVHL